MGPRRAAAASGFRRIAAALQGAGLPAGAAPSSSGQRVRYTRASTSWEGLHGYGGCFADIFVQANGLRHHLVARGMPGAPVVMMIHGLAGQAHTFDSIAARLSATYHVYCLDVRGRGETEWGPADGYHMGNYVRDLEAAREALGLESMALVGTSMGGLISMQYACEYPSRVQRTVLNDIGPEIDPSGLQRIVAYVGKAPEGFPDMKAVVKYYKENYGPMMARASDEQVAEFAKWNVRKSDSAVYVWKMDPAVRTAPPVAPPREPWEAYRGMKCPVLDLCAGGERREPRGAAHGVEKADASLVEVPGVGHAPLLVEPEAVKAVEAFLGA
jgi:pimeloyl-ACP methyl ester carboxylesterase